VSLTARKEHARFSSTLPPLLSTTRSSS